MADDPILNAGEAVADARNSDPGASSLDLKMRQQRSQLSDRQLEQIVTCRIEPRSPANQLLGRDDVVLQLTIDTEKQGRLREALRHIDRDRVSDLREATRAALDPLGFLSELLSVEVEGVAFDPKRDRYALETADGDLFWIGSIRQILKRGHLAAILAERHGVLPTMDKDCQPKLLILALQWAPRARALGETVDHSTLYLEFLLQSACKAGTFPEWTPTSKQDGILHAVFKPPDEDRIMIHLPKALDWLRENTTHEPRQGPMVKVLKDNGFEQSTFNRRCPDGFFQIRCWKSRFAATEWKPRDFGPLDRLLSLGERGGYPR